MRKFVKEARWAYQWSVKWPADRDIMRQFVTRSWDIHTWLERWPEDVEYFENVTEVPD